MSVLQFPIVKVVIGFVFGLLTALYCDFELAIGTIIIFCCCFLFLWTYFFAQKKIIFGVAVFLFSVGIGIFTHTLHTDIFHKNHYIYKISDRNQIVNLTLDSKLKPNTYNHRYYAKINSIDNQKSVGTVLVNLHKSIYPKELEIGTNLEIFSKISLNSIPKNPSQFDYGKYLERQKVYAQIY